MPLQENVALEEKHPLHLFDQPHNEAQVVTRNLILFLPIFPQVLHLHAHGNDFMK